MLSYTFIEGFLEKHLEKNKVIALGTSMTSQKIIKQMALHNVIKDLKLRIVPTSLEIAHVLSEFNIPLAKPEEHIDLVIEFGSFADKFCNYVKTDTTSLVIDKIIANMASKVFVFLEAEKYENYYDLTIPFEVSTFCIKHTLNSLSAFGEAKLRKKDGRAVRTVGGNYLIDLELNKSISFDDLEYKTRQIPGVFETGCFLGEADKIYLVHKNKIEKKLDRL
ncbi:MAG: ribose-5-phosphate isomerase A [Candidatus ainarchaeum sp.]|nr:ribose-5-phosphate isomerase A [Candidatus ainarchaeum sp.]